MSDEVREGSFPGGFPYLVVGSGPPLVYLQGVSPPELFAETAAAIPKGRLVVYPREGHSVTISRAFFRDVLDFLAE